MFKAIVVAAILALAVAAPEPKPKPGLVAAYSAPLVGAPLAYSAGYAAPVVSTYGAAPVVSTYHGAAYTSPYAYSAYPAYSAPVVYA